MGKKKTQIQIRKENEAAKTARLDDALAKVRKSAKSSAITGKKRKDSTFLGRYLGVALHSASAIRYVEGFESRSYSLSKQVVELIDFLFVRYKPPEFLYAAMLSRSGRMLVRGESFDASKPDQPSPTIGIERRIFLAAAQGSSVAHELVGILNKREAHWFLKAPTQNSFGQNLFWAKCACLGMPESGAQFLTERLADRTFLERIGDRLDDMLRFFADAYPTMTPNSRHEIVDFVRAVAENPAFSFKGRTLSSMIALCLEWHATTYAGVIKKYESWPCRFPAWEHRNKFGLVRAIELTNNRALAEEGKRQRHCVFSYTQSCVQGHSRIVSLRWIEEVDGAPDKIESRITVEVSMSSEAVVQAKGSSNRSPREEERKALRHWAQAQGLKVELWDE